MNTKKEKNRNPEMDFLESQLIEKFGAKEYELARDRAKLKIEMANAMKQRRISMDMNQADLANILHTTQQQLSRYEIGKNSPTLDKLFDICHALNLELIIRNKENGEEIIHI